MILGTATMISRREKRSVTGRVKACLFVGISGMLVWGPMDLCAYVYNRPLFVGPIWDACCSCNLGP